MEQAWGSGQNRRWLSVDDINSLMPASGLIAVEAHLIEEGHANTNYLLVLADGRQLIFRQYIRAPAVAGLEAAVLRHFDSVIPVPRLFFTDVESAVSLSEWRPGRTMESLIAAGEIGQVVSAAADLGRALARISSVRFDRAGEIGPDLTVTDPWPSPIEGLLGYLDFCLGRESMTARVGTDLVRQIESHVHGRRAALEATGQTPCLVHGDYKAANLLIHEGRLSAVLDWEFCHSGTYLLDIGQLFRHSEALPEAFEAGFVEGITNEGGLLPENWRSLARAIDLINLADFLGRADASSQMVAHVTSLVRKTLDQD